MGNKVTVLIEGQDLMGDARKAFTHRQAAALELLAGEGRRDCLWAISPSVK